LGVFSVTLFYLHIKSNKLKYCLFDCIL